MEKKKSIGVIIQSFFGVFVGLMGVVGLYLDFKIGSIGLLMIFP